VVKDQLPIDPVKFAALQSEFRSWQASWSKIVARKREALGHGFALAQRCASDDPMRAATLRACELAAADLIAIEDHVSREVGEWNRLVADRDWRLGLSNDDPLADMCELRTQDAYADRELRDLLHAAADRARSLRRLENPGQVGGEPAPEEE